MVTVGRLELLPEALLARAERVHSYAVARGAGHLGVVGLRRRGRWATSRHAAQPHQSEQPPLSGKSARRPWHPLYGG